MKKIFLFWLFFLIVYLLVAGRGKFEWKTTSRNYFSLQAYSWTKGRIDLVVFPKDVYDLSIYEKKVYLYWPPLPALFALPFVIFWGIEVSDVFYTAFWASLGPIFMYLVLFQARRSRVIPQLSDKYLWLLVFFFAFGTVYFYLSVIGTVWFTSQVISLLPFLSSLIFLFRYLEKRVLRDFIVSLILVSLSFWGRSTLLFNFFLWLFILFFRKDKNKKILGLSLIVLVLFNLLLFCSYNYLRFGNFLENGLKIHNSHPRWRQDLVRFGVINTQYVFHNFFYMFIKPVSFEKTFPFIVPDPEGNSIFSTSPFLLLLFGLFSKKNWRKGKIYLSAFLFTSIMVIIFLLLYFSTGWYQFGYRYLLDILPYLVLSVAYTLRLFPSSFVIGLFTISLVINILGTYWMMQFYQ